MALGVLRDTCTDASISGVPGSGDGAPGATRTRYLPQRCWFSKVSPNGPSHLEARSYQGPRPSPRCRCEWSEVPRAATPGPEWERLTQAGGRTCIHWWEKKKCCPENAANCSLARTSLGGGKWSTRNNEVSRAIQGLALKHKLTTSTVSKSPTGTVFCSPETRWQRGEMWVLL